MRTVPSADCQVLDSEALGGGDTQGFRRALHLVRGLESAAGPGFSAQVPLTRALERDERYIRHLNSEVIFAPTRSPAVPGVFPQGVESTSGAAARP
jgi:hypothetical protein